MGPGGPGKGIEVFEIRLKTRYKDGTVTRESVPYMVSLVTRLQQIMCPAERVEYIVITIVDPKGDSDGH